MVKLRLTPVTGAVTVTALVAVLPPSWVETVIVALPAATAATTPLLFTVATPELLLDHVKSLSGNKARMDRDDLPPDYNGTGKMQ